MGWSTWRIYQVGFTDSIVRTQANALVSSGLLASGYNTIFIDDGWMTMSRDVNGNLVPDPAIWPNGLNAFAKYIQSLGMSLGWYLGTGTLDCTLRPGSQGRENKDIQFLLSRLGTAFSYLKYDSCTDFGTNAATQAQYQVMGTVLSRMGGFRYQVSCPGFVDDGGFGSNSLVWGQSVGGTEVYSNIDAGNPNTWPTFISLMTSQVGRATYATPNRWNMPNFLGTGNGTFTDAEARSEFVFFCLIASPLILSADLTTFTANSLTLARNSELIAVDQDPLGIAALLISNIPVGTGNLFTWARQLSKGRWCVGMFNTDSVAHNITTTFSTITNTNQSWYVRDLLAHSNLGSFTGTYTASNVASHDVSVIMMNPLTSGGQTVNTPNISTNPFLQSAQVVPNNPPDMSVLVNWNNPGLPVTSLNIPGVGTSPQSGITQIPIVAPGTNSYYATIYFDQITSGYGVSYSTASATPNIQYPDFMSQIPLACILIPSTATIVTASMIQNLNPLSVAQSPLNFWYSNGGLQTVNCHGATLVTGAFDTGGTGTLRLTQLRVGVPLMFTFFNSSGSPGNVLIHWFAPSSGPRSVTGKVPGSPGVNLDGTGMSVPAGGNIFLSGATMLQNNGGATQMSLIGG